MALLHRFKSLFGDTNSSYLSSLEPILQEIGALEEKVSKLSSEELGRKTFEFRNKISAGGALDKILPEAFATVRETARRTLGERHFDVQILGGIILHRGQIAEMKTGEGKTLVCTLPAYLNALAGQGVHVITVNDYLARRDVVWMGQIYAALGLSVGVINHASSFLYDPGHNEVDNQRDEEGSFRVFHQFLRPCTRREAYEADITYGTNNEFGFDYLRDHLAQESNQVVQTGLVNRLNHHFAIIDEVDSVLIDEARTPLIIAAPVADSAKLYQVFARLAKTLAREEDYVVDEKTKTTALTDSGITKAEKSLGLENLYTEGGVKYVHHLETAVRAEALFQKDRDYVVREGEVVIVDEFTGRLQPGRRWSEGLHQAVEAKEGAKVQQESRTFASVTFQNYFKLYKKVSGMTGTAMTSAEEFAQVYGLESFSVPTNKESQRQDLNDLIFQTKGGKLRAITRKVKELYERGQPVLVGTVSIEQNELISNYFKKAGVPHRLLNAKNHEDEGAVIVEAGKKGSVVVATNMAGRGVDIKLGGIKAAKEEYEEVKALGGLFVLGTERHEARRIDNQLRGRSGRQGDPGDTQFFISLEDDLARVFAAEKIKSLMGRFGIPEDEPIANKLVSRAIESAQSKIEGLNFDLRKHLLDYDNVLNHQRKIIYERRQRILFSGEEAVDEFLKQVESKEELTGEQKVILRRVILQVTDLYWVDHLEAMEYLRSSVRLRAYGQRDPLVEYKKEGLVMFREMEQRIYDDVLKLIPTLKAGEAVKSGGVAEEGLKTVHQSVSLLGRGEGQQKAAGSNRPVAVQSGPKVGRNDPCPCGSGKKYKKCHGS